MPLPSLVCIMWQLHIHPSRGHLQGSSLLKLCIHVYFDFFEKALYKYFSLIWNTLCILSQGLSGQLWCYSMFMNTPSAWGTKCSLAEYLRSGFWEEIVVWGFTHPKGSNMNQAWGLESRQLEKQGHPRKSGLFEWNIYVPFPIWVIQMLVLHLRPYLLC